jgi:hypothetical protein
VLTGPLRRTQRRAYPQVSEAVSSNMGVEPNAKTKRERVSQAAAAITTPPPGAATVGARAGPWPTTALLFATNSGARAGPWPTTALLFATNSKRLRACWAHGDEATRRVP